VSEKIALVLGGGGARGAYEVGALSVLLPWLEEADERPDVIVGTSIGALNAADLAAHAHEDVTEVLEEGCREWLRIGYRNLLESLWSIGELTAVGRLAASLVFPGIVPSSLLDPAPLVGTVHRLVKVDDIHRNVVAPDVALRACAVVTTAAHTNRSVVFHDGGCNPPADERRGIDYAPTPITEAHIRASAAIPVAFPAVEVCEPEGSQGWYFAAAADKGRQSALTLRALSLPTRGAAFSLNTRPPRAHRPSTWRRRGRRPPWGERRCHSTVVLLQQIAPADRHRREGR
jgi:NTE family protein